MAKFVSVTNKPKEYWFPLGIVYSNKRIRRTAWDLFVGYKTRGFRIVEWPWQGGSVQWYWGDRWWHKDWFYRNKS